MYTTINEIVICDSTSVWVTGSANDHCGSYFRTEPQVPPRSSLISVNVTSVSLNLAAWLDGGCPITSLVVEYKVRVDSNIQRI